jgi:putative transposase
MLLESRSFFAEKCSKISVKIMSRTVKSITDKEILRLHPEVKNKLWCGSFWATEYYVGTVIQYGNEYAIQKYIQNQGEEKTVYKSFNKNQLRLSFE